MKQLFFIGALLSFFTAPAQMKEGKIIYERVFQLPIRTFHVDPAIASQIPKSRTDQFELLFANNQSLWQFLPSAVNESETNTFAGGGMVLRFSAGANDMSYYDFDKGTLVEQREVFEKSFVVTDSIRKLDWKLSDETRVILNYTCRKATATRISTRTQMSMENGVMKSTPVQDTALVVAWFASDIPVPVGPVYQGQLPGAILELDIDNGQTVYKAIEISPKVNASKIKAPREGRKLTAAEFETERQKLLEEMRKNMGGGERLMIRQ